MSTQAPLPRVAEGLSAPEAKLRDFMRVAVERSYCQAIDIEAALKRVEAQAQGREVRTQDLAALLVGEKILTQQQAWACERAARGTTLIGGFELYEKVGQGGMGAVFRARQISMDRIVALKILPPKLARDPLFQKRFFQEARTSAKLSHLHIINGIDCGEVGGYTYFAMEFVDGETVKQQLKSRGKLPVEEATAIVRQIAEALAYAKQMGMVHRDVKPDNIMITRNNVAKLCDLGLAKSTDVSEQDPSLSQAGLAVGTPHYISPEQARGDKDVDFHADIYSLGATFYHMLTGKTPFTGPSSAAVMRLHISSETQNPCDLESSLPLGYGQIIAMMMAKEPQQRYESPEALLADLDAVKAGDSPKAAMFKAASSCALPAARARAKFGTSTVAAALNAGLTSVRSAALPPAASTRSIRMALVAALGLIISVALIVLALRSPEPDETAHGQPPENAQPQPQPQPALPRPTQPAPAEPPVPPALPGPSDPPPVPHVPAPPPTQPSQPVPTQPLAPSPALPQPAPSEPPTPVAVQEPKPAEELPPPKLVLSADILYTRFLRLLHERSGKVELFNLKTEMTELARKPEYDVARTDISAELEDLEAALQFENDAVQKLISKQPQLELSGEAARKFGSRGKALSYEAGRGINFAVDNGPTLPVPLSVIALSEILKHGHSAAASRLVYLSARGELDKARALLGHIPAEQRARYERKLQLIAADETELTAQLVLDSLGPLVAANSWGTFRQCLAEFEKKYGATAVARKNTEQLNLWKLGALEAARPMPQRFNAASVKLLEDGFVELVYDFARDEQARDFSCGHEKLSVRNGRLTVPPGGGEFGHARFSVPFDQLRSLQAVGRSDHPTKPRRLRLIFANPALDTLDQDPTLCLRAEKVDTEHFQQAATTPLAAIDNRTDVDIRLTVKNNSECEWTVNGQPLGTSRCADLKGRQLLLSCDRGLHSWRTLKLVFKPDAAWLQAGTPKAPAAGDLRSGLWGEYYSCPNELTELPARLEPAWKLFAREDKSVAFRTRAEFNRTDLPERFCVHWSGYLEIPADGIYGVGTESDDGSRLYIDGKLAVDNGGLHTLRLKGDRLQLQAGRHELKVEYFNVGTECGCKLLWRVGDGQVVPIPEKNLFHKKH